MSCLDFWFWLVVMEEVRKSRPSTLTELKALGEAFAECWPRGGKEVSQEHLESCQGLQGSCRHKLQGQPKDNPEGFSPVCRMSSKVEFKNDWENHYKRNKGLIVRVLLKTVILKHPVYPGLVTQTGYYQGDQEQDNADDHSISLNISRSCHSNWSLSGWSGTR